MGYKQNERKKDTIAVLKQLWIKTHSNPKAEYFEKHCALNLIK